MNIYTPIIRVAQEATQILNSTQDYALRTQLRGMIDDLEAVARQIQNVECLKNSARKVNPSLVKRFQQSPKAVTVNVRIAITKACPACGSKQGEYCVTTSGTTRYTNHLSRRFN